MCVREGDGGTRGMRGHRTKATATLVFNALYTKSLDITRCNQLIPDRHELLDEETDGVT